MKAFCTVAFGNQCTCQFIYTAFRTPEDDCKLRLVGIQEIREYIQFFKFFYNSIELFDLGIACTLVHSFDNPLIVKTMNQGASDPQIEEFYNIVKELEKLDVFTNFLDTHQPELAIVFGRTKRRVDELTSALIAKGYRAEGLHGDITQSKRLEVLKKFRNNALDILVATD